MAMDWVNMLIDLSPSILYQFGDPGVDFEFFAASKKPRSFSGELSILMARSSPCTLLGSHPSWAKTQFSWMSSLVAMSIHLTASSCFVLRAATPQSEPGDHRRLVSS